LPLLLRSLAVLSCRSGSRNGKTCCAFRRSAFSLMTTPSPSRACDYKSPQPASSALRQSQSSIDTAMGCMPYSMGRNAWLATMLPVT
jgi:hypothetical protein